MKIENLLGFAKTDGADLSTLTHEELLTLANLLVKESKLNAIDAKYLIQVPKLRAELKESEERAAYWLEQSNSRHSHVEQKLMREIALLHQKDAEQTKEITALRSLIASHDNTGEEELF